MNESTAIQYNRAKTWQLILWPLNTTTNNVMNILLMFLSYVAVGGYGIAVVMAGMLATYSRIFDAFTDPLIAIITDRMHSKFGRVRIAMLIGLGIQILALLALFVWGIGQGIVFFTIMYFVYYIGSSFNSVSINTGNVILTRDPHQRPIIYRWGIVYITLIATFTSVFLSNVIFKKYGSISVEALQELCYIVIGICTVCAILSIIAISEKDKPENFPKKSNGKSINLKDAWSLLKSNRALQTYIIAATSDKIAQQTATQSAISIMLFGIVIGNYAFYGTYNFIVAVPTLVLVFYATRIAGKTGTKKALIKWTTASIIFAVATIVFMALIDTTQITVSAVPTVIFLILTATYSACMRTTGAFTSAMQPDIVDYELYRSGTYMPGTVASLYNMIDKTVSSVGATITALAVASLGYVAVQPQPGDPLTSALFWMTMLLWLGVPVIGNILTLIAMKWYPLDKVKMAEVQEHNREIHAAARIKANADDNKKVIG